MSISYFEAIVVYETPRRIDYRFRRKVVAMFMDDCGDLVAERLPVGI